MVLPGETLLVYEMTPALFAAVAANEAERVAPDVTLVDVAMIGAAGRIYMSGPTDSIERARDAVKDALREFDCDEQVIEQGQLVFRGPAMDHDGLRQNGISRHVAFSSPCPPLRLRCRLDALRSLVAFAVVTLSALSGRSTCRGMAFA